MRSIEAFCSTPRFRSDLVAAVPHLRRYAWALLINGGSIEPDDLVQSTVERALARADTCRPDSNVRVWLFTILHNLYVDKVRRLSRESDALIEMGGTRPVPIEPNPTAALELKDLASALAKLPAEQREAILLVSLEGLRYDEAAIALGVPIGTIRSRLSRGRESLRLMLSAGAQSG